MTILIVKFKHRPVPDANLSYTEKEIINHLIYANPPESTVDHKENVFPYPTPILLTTKYPGEN